MSIDNSSVVDALGIETSTGRVVLTISDHLPWSEPEAHLQLLAAKLNRYLAFIESGEMVSAYPEATGREVIIQIVAKYPLSDRALEALNSAKQALATAGVGFRHRTLVNGELVDTT